MTIIDRIVSVFKKPAFDFYVDGVKYTSNVAKTNGLNIKFIAGVDEFQSLYLETDGPFDEQVFYGTAVDLSAKPLRFFTAPRVIGGG